MGPPARELFLTILCPSARFQRRATGGKRLSMPLSGMKSVRWQTSGEKTFLRVVWWLRHGASTSTRSKVRNGEVRGSSIKPSRLYLSRKHCRPNKNYGVAGWGGGAVRSEHEASGTSGSHRSLSEGGSQGHLSRRSLLGSHLAEPKLQWSFLTPRRYGLVNVLIKAQGL